MAIAIEIFQGTRAACLNCKRRINKGDSSVACRNRWGKVRARFCSTTCEEEYSWVVIERRVGACR